MTSFKDLAQMRRSHRKFSSQEIDPEHLKLILRAALMSPTSKSQRAWQFVVVDDPVDIEKLSDAKNMGSQFLKGAPVAIAVLGDPMRYAGSLEGAVQRERGGRGQTDAYRYHACDVLSVHPAAVRDIPSDHDLCGSFDAYLLQ
jgi:nitroreductase